LEDVKDGVRFEKAIFWDFNGLSVGIFVGIKVVGTTDVGERTSSEGSPQSLCKMTLVGFDDAFFKSLPTVNSFDFA
jgi:hypothetical protein